MGGSWAPLGASWGRLGDVLGTSWRVLGASWAHLGASWNVLERLGHLQASKIEKSLKNQRKTIKNHPNINLTRHGTGSADFFLDASCSLRFPKQVSWNVFGSQSLPQAPGRSARFARCGPSIFDRRIVQKSIKIQPNIYQLVKQHAPQHL